MTSDHTVSDLALLYLLLLQLHSLSTCTASSPCICTIRQYFLAPGHYQDVELSPWTWANNTSMPLSSFSSCSSIPPFLTLLSCCSSELCTLFLLHSCKDFQAMNFYWRCLVPRVQKGLRNTKGHNYVKLNFFKQQSLPAPPKKTIFSIHQTATESLCLQFRSCAARVRWVRRRRRRPWSPRWSWPSPSSWWPPRCARAGCGRTPRSCMVHAGLPKNTEFSSSLCIDFLPI